MYIIEYTINNEIFISTLEHKLLKDIMWEYEF